MKPVTLPLLSLVHDDRPSYIQAGYGGRSISEWPFYEFIRLYIAGYEQQCVDQWTEWLLQQFSKFQTTPKNKGGMFQGSVHRNAAEHSHVNTASALQAPELLPEEDIRKGAQMLVYKRLKMVESIKVQGYLPENGDRIAAVRKGDRVVLFGGHHRAATLYALNYQKLAGIYVYSRYQWRIRECLKTTKTTLNLVRHKIMNPG